MTTVTPRRRRIVGAALAASLGWGVLGAGPVAATTPADPTGLSSVLGGLLGGQHHHKAAHRDRRSFGHTGAPNGTLRPGCHNYPYHYVLTPPTNDWTLEVYLKDPTGDGVASDAFMSDSDPKRQRSHFRFCRNVTRPGRFTIRAKLHWYRGSHDHKVWLEPSHFRLRRP